MIKTERLHLWALERHDLGKNYQWANDMELTRLAGSLPLPKAMGELEAWYNNLQTNPEQRVLAIKLHDGAYIGNIELRDLDLRCANAELGIIIGEANYRGHGYGSEAVRAMCDFAFRQLRLHRLSVHVLEENERALKMFQKCGFILEGVQRQAFFQEGRYWNVRALSLLEDEYRPLPSQPTLSEED